MEKAYEIKVILSLIRPTLDYGYIFSTVYMVSALDLIISNLEKITFQNSQRGRNYFSLNIHNITL